MSPKDSHIVSYVQPGLVTVQLNTYSCRIMCKHNTAIHGEPNDSLPFETLNMLSKDTVHTPRDVSHSVISISLVVFTCQLRCCHCVRRAGIK